jgi:histidyl-tRNA synthetase
MYTFTDLGGRSVSLRPEGTPGVLRAIIENRLALPQKLYYVEPMFRQERPQKGRFREFNQIGLEVVGLGSPIVDAEVIAVASAYLTGVGVPDAVPEINSIGCSECRPAFREALLAFVRPRLAKFCPDCRSRAERNPLRAYDCKNEQCQRILDQAPRAVEHLCPACRDHYGRVKQYLGLYGVRFVENHKLVRGLDYYTRTVFEVKSRELGAQDTLLGGGRYDHLMQELGGDDAPAIGFALGLERLALSVTRPADKVGGAVSLYLVVLGETGVAAAVGLQQRLVKRGFVAMLGDPEKPLKRQLKDADRMQISQVVIIGEDEVRENCYTVRDMKQGSQRKVPGAELDRILDTLAP